MNKPAWLFFTLSTAAKVNLDSFIAFSILFFLSSAARTQGLHSSDDSNHMPHFNNPEPIPPPNPSSSASPSILVTRSLWLHVGEPYTNPMLPFTPAVITLL